MTTSFAEKLRFATRELEWSALALGRGRCPLCGGRFFLRLSRDLLGTRCLACTASPISMAIGATLRDRVPDFASLRVYELSTRGPVFDFLTRSVQRAGGTLTGSEYFEDVEPGGWRDGAQCQDVERLTYAAESFDLCTSTEVFEHVPDDRRGFAEIHRVLAPAGWLVFTVPLHHRPETVVRAVREGDDIRHLAPPTYHDDFIRGTGRVLVFRDYGRDITERLREAGFREAEILELADPAGLGATARVVLARKAGP